MCKMDKQLQAPCCFEWVLQKNKKSPVEGVVLLELEAPAGGMKILLSSPPIGAAGEDWPCWLLLSMLPVGCRS